MNLNRLILILALNATFISTAQKKLETYPVFENCESISTKKCFNETFISELKEKYSHPNDLDTTQLIEAKLLFEVDTAGVFKPIFINTSNIKVKRQLEKAIAKLPQIKPATYNAKPRFVRYNVTVKVPFELSENFKLVQTNSTANKTSTEIKTNPLKLEYDRLKNQKFNDEQFDSQLNIPFSHEVYNRFDKQMNMIGTNTHTASKPFSYEEVKPYYSFKDNVETLRFETDTWFGKKFFNEDLVTIKGEDYWFTINIGADLQLGKDFDSNSDYTYNNTRAAFIQGQLGKKINVFTAIYESQGRFADYFNRYAESIGPYDGNPATIPSRGIAKRFGEDAYDYPIAEGYISYKPSQYFRFTLGHGQNFIGDGYRSLFISDNASIHPYFKIETNVWKLKYTNTWRSLRDIRSAVNDNGSYRTKFMATHHLSYNVTKRLNLGLFESVIWENDNNRGFDFNYLNPVILYQMIQFSTGSEGGNALIGLSYKYKWTDQINSYGQLIIDEFSSDAVFGGQQSWKNKLGYQLGVKYFDAFKVKDLTLQVEYNQVRPYTYSHNTGVLNYGHNNQSLAHQWGANFRELIGIARYRKDRWYGHTKLIFGKRGLETNENFDPYYGGIIFGNERDRAFENNVKIGQGNTVNIFIGELELGYLLNPKTNLKLYTSLIYRDFNASTNTSKVFDNTTTWLNFGFRTDLFNWYYDR
ncbi:gliding motility protein RemB [Psychroflexus sp. ALD_RP9]|uniref:gliding motility protein RemB n=1 Tax=Psychroflexus sp. ALD_RP9 TaxID=2777186 RepID=UPI001F5DF0AA|nr:gliding motility protein RemB [Psychroflexus sp. ALD_RP9]